MKTTKQHSNGFSLIEMLLVLVIVSGILYIGAGYMQQRALSLRVDRTSGQMQQIMNAGMSYYVSNNKWPTLTDLVNGGYIPSAMTSPFGTAYTVNSTASNFYVAVVMPNKTATSVSIAKTIVGTLPLGFTATSNTATTPTTCISGGALCYVIGTVNIPSSNLSNAQSVNFAGLYHNGACVPAPQCPANFTAQAFAVPVAVNGFYTAPSGTSSPCTATDKSGCNMTYYPLNGYTAYTTSDTAVNYTASTKPIDCGTDASTTSACYTDSNNSTEVASDGTSYWRVCISVTTSSGEVKPTGTMANPWGQLTGTVMVMTRCKPNSENVGSDFTAWSPSS